MKPWDFDGDEVVFFIAAAILAGYGLIQWYWPLICRTSIGRRSPGGTMSLAATPIIALAGLFILLATWSDPKYVVGHIDYILLFLAGGGAWLALAVFSGRVLGIDVRDDAIVRDNPAATIACCGIAIAITILYAACNIGAGPTIWTTIWPALLATGVWFVLWVMIDALTHIGEQITIDRDVAAALRHAGWAIAVALVLGRAMAGDWTAWEQTHADMVRLGWPAVLLSAAVVPLHRIFRPTPDEPRRSIFAAGMMPAILLIALAAGYVATLGLPEVGKHIITYEEYMRSR